MNIIEHTLSDGTKLTSYIHEDIFPDGSSYSARPGIVVFPGGGYSKLSKRENEPVVLEFLSRGYQVFVLEYAVGIEEIKKREPEKDAAEAVAWIRENREELKTTHVVLMGFSAGGHAALSLLCHWKEYGDSSRPDAGILCYPVVTMRKEYTHLGTMENITMGDE
ncbi:MAG: alpha/beta hydrolase, partial [Candidatus Ornithospirochaeta sp.]